jgi:hypothetical protein
MNSASLCSLAGRYDNPIPPRFLAPIDFLKIPAQYAADNPMPESTLSPHSGTMNLANGSWLNFLVPTVQYLQIKSMHRKQTLAIRVPYEVWHFQGTVSRDFFGFCDQF